MSDVFVSYARADLERVRPLVDQLRAHGVAVFWDDDIPLGREWSDVLEERLGDCRAVVAVWTENSVKSESVRVEGAEALKRDVLVPVRLDDVRPPFDFKRRQMADLVGWDQSASHPEFQKVLKALGVEPGGRPSEDSTNTAARTYLEWVRENNTRLALGQMVPGALDSIELDKVYTRLHLTGGGGLEEGGEGADPRRMEAEREKTVEDVLGAHADAVLIGDPGSGKTTVLRWVAQNVARALLDEPERLAEIGLDGPAPFPVHIELARFADWVEKNPSDASDDAAPAYLYRRLTGLQEDHAWKLPAGYLADRVRAGGCMLLFDGLDEVADGMRERVGRLIENVIAEGRTREPPNRHLVTCRTRAWRKRSLGSGEAVLQLAPMRWEEVEEFVGHWVKALPGPEPSKGWSMRDREIEAYRVRLLGDLRGVPQARKLASTPLMVTLMAAIHWNRKAIPKQRAELLRAAVGYMLEARLAKATEAGFGTDRRRGALQAVARRMFVGAGASERKVLGLADAAKVVAPMLGIGPGDARTYLGREMEWSGLLTGRAIGELEFAHLVLGEYLVAERLSEEEDGLIEVEGDAGWTVLDPHIHDAGWSEVVVLYAGCRLHANGASGVRAMIESVLEGGVDRTSKARAVGLVGRILAEVRSDEDDEGDPLEGTEYRAMLDETLSIFEPGEELVDESIRIEVGEALGQVGDPRLADPSLNRVWIEGGTFWMGAQGVERETPKYDPRCIPREAPVREVTVSGFYLGRFPVTVQEFRTFLDLGGYQSEAHWSQDGWVFIEQGRASPNGWEDQLDHPTWPVGGLSWYEADAFCRWVGGRLPTEAEWELAAGGEVGRRYPWGSDEPDDKRANFAFRVGAPTPVGVYPLGATPEGVVDLAGNVWEWVADWFGKYDREDSVDPGGPDTGLSRVLRGASFYYTEVNLRCSFRGNRPPSSDHDGNGFRVAWPGGQ